MEAQRSSVESFPASDVSGILRNLGRSDGVSCGELRLIMRLAGDACKRLVRQDIRNEKVMAELSESAIDLLSF